MTEEEYFRKHYPDVCYNGKPLSPYWDLFQDGVEFGERQSEKKIKELERKLKVETELSKRLGVAYREYEQLTKEQDEHIVELEKENAELKNNLTSINCLENAYSFGRKEGMKQLTKAKDLILKLYNAGRDVLMCRAEEKAYDNLSNVINDRSIEQFLKEIEK